MMLLTSLILFGGLSSAKSQQLPGESAPLLKAPASHQPANCHEHLSALEARIQVLEKVLLASDHLDDDLKAVILGQDIEEEVKQNTEDIVQLRLADDRHDMLLSQELTKINYINNTIIPSLEHKVDVSDEALKGSIDQLVDHDAYIDATRPPLGSIVAWLPSYSSSSLPSGWQRCDGSAITEGPLAGTSTPDLNSARRFMRGGSDAAAGTAEEDSVQDHLHADSGHTHSVIYSLLFLFISKSG